MPPNSTSTAKSNRIAKNIPHVFSDSMQVLLIKKNQKQQQQKTINGLTHESYNS